MKRAADASESPPSLLRQRTDEPSRPVTLVATDGARVTLSPQAAALSTTLAHTLVHGGDGSLATEFKTWPPNSGADGTILQLIAQLAEVIAGGDAAEIARAEIKLEILPAAAKLALVRVANFLNMPRVHKKAVQWASLIFIGSADDVRLRLGHTRLASKLASAAFEEPLLSAPPAPAPETSVEDMTVPELKRELVALGASDVGKKAELQRRLREARSSSKEAGGGDDLETALGGPEGVDAVFALLDAATLRMLKTVSASCLFEVRRVLSDATSSWRKSPKWTAPKWVRELTFEDEDGDGYWYPCKDGRRIDWKDIKQLDGAVELPYLAPQLVQLLTSSSVAALRAIRAMDVSVQAVHMTQIMANVAQSIGPEEWTYSSSKLEQAEELFSQMIELKLEPSVLAEAVLLVTTTTSQGRSYGYPSNENVKTLADQIMQSITAQPAVLEPHIGALIDWCIDFGQDRLKDVATKISLLQQLPSAAFAEHAPKLVTLVCTCTGDYDNLPDLSFKLCSDKIEPAVRAPAIGAALKQKLQDLKAPDDDDDDDEETRQESRVRREDELLRLVSLLRDVRNDELLPLTDVVVALLGASSRVAVVASELLCALPDVAVAPHVPAMTALLMTLDDDIDDNDDDNDDGQAGSSSAGLTTKPAPAAGGLFGAAPAASPFGAPAPAAFGFFGAAPLFGAPAPAAGGLFGAAPAAASFGASAKAAGGLWALRLVKAIASLSPALLYTHAGAFVEVRLHHPVTQVRIAAAEIVSRAAQSIDA